MKRNKVVGGAIIFIFALGFPWLFPNPALMGIVVFTLLFAAVATGWNLFSGYTGYISLGHGAFFGIGAYAVALLCQRFSLSGGYLPFVLLPVAGLIASAFAIPLGWIALRTRRQTFVVVTIALFFIAQLMAYNLSGITNGSTGLSLPLPPWEGFFYNIPFYYVTLVMLLLAFFVSRWVRRSKYGLGLLALRDDEERASGLGVNTETAKLLAFVLSAWFAGVGGGIDALFIGSIAPAFAFDPTINVGLSLAVFLGGVGTLWGPILGAVMLVPVQQYLVLQFGENGLYQMIYGTLFLIVLAFMPIGIVPTLTIIWKNILNRCRNALKTTTPSPALSQEGVSKD